LEHVTSTQHPAPSTQHPVTLRSAKLTINKGMPISAAIIKCFGIPMFIA